MEPWIDPIVEEVRAAREAYASALNHDLAAICADLRKAQALHPERIASFGPRRLPDLPRAA